MRIESIEIRVCRNTQVAMSDSEMRTGGRSTFDFLVITLKTDKGVEGTSFGFAGRGAEMAGQIASSALKPFFLGKDPLAREKPWKEFRTYDRWWNSGSHFHSSSRRMVGNNGGSLSHGLKESNRLYRVRLPRCRCVPRVRSQNGWGSADPAS